MLKGILLCCEVKNLKNKIWKIKPNFEENDLEKLAQF